MISNQKAKHIHLKSYRKPKIRKIFCSDVKDQIKEELQDLNVEIKSQNILNSNKKINILFYNPKHNKYYLKKNRKVRTKKTDEFKQKRKAEKRERLNYKYSILNELN